MATTIQNISVIGDGGWGTTLAIHLAKQNYPVTLWGPFPIYVQKMERNRYNSKFLPGFRIPKEVTLKSDLKEAIASADLIVFAIPSKFTLNILKDIKSTKINLKDKTLISVTKGFDDQSRSTISEIIQKQIGPIELAVLSGPTIAKEVAAEIPSTAVIASNKLSTAKKLQTIFNSEYFRIYTNTDIIGVEIGGSIKNIIAVACGICDGLGFGTNTKSALVTRGLSEISRLGKALGAKQKTFSGLTGIGDLVTTCFSPSSRNRTVGEKLGKGKSIDEIMNSMEMVAEGIDAVKTAYKLSVKHDISMPITSEIYNIVYKGKSASKAVSDLMNRKVKSE